MISLKRILVPVDFSDQSKAAIAYARELCALADANLYLLHVPGSTGENFEADFPIGPFEKAGLEPVKPAGGTSRGPEYAIRIGHAADEIVRYAGDRDVDLIVMGTHGRSGVSHMLMGSVAEKVIRGSGCPVLVVRGPRRATA